MSNSRVIKKYNDLLEKFGDRPEALGWNKKRQALRFKILCENFNMKPECSVLDFGCGFGDMYKFLSESYPRVDYEGVDINQGLIKKGKEKYPKAKISEKDILKNGLNKKYDFIFSSGVHNVKFDDNELFNEDTFKLFYEHCNIGFAVNFLSDKVESLTEESFHSSPLKILELAYKFTNRVVMRNDYMPFEFTIYVFKDDLFKKEHAVFTEYEKFLS